MRAEGRVFWAATWLAIVLVAVKAYYLGAPAAPTLRSGWDYLRDLTAVSFVDTLFAALFWSCASAALLVLRHRPSAGRGIAVVIVAAGAVSCLYALASVFFFGVFGGFLTYPLLALVGDVHMLRSSVQAQVSPATLVALAALPLVYLALVGASMRWLPRSSAPTWPRLAAVLLIVWVGAGEQSFTREWTTRRDRQVAANAPWVLLSSWWQG